MKTRRTEEIERSFHTFFEDAPAGEPLMQYTMEAAAPVAGPDAILDRILMAIKWIFLYLPGVAYLHGLFGVLGFSLIGDFWDAGMILSFAAAIVTGTFLVMLGLGKLRDLRYLVVVAGIVSVSILTNIVQVILGAFVSVDYFGTAYLLSLVLVLFVGHLLKSHTDHKTDAAA